jgi:hypothetical protein
MSASRLLSRVGLAHRATAYPEQGDPRDLRLASRVLHETNTAASPLMRKPDVSHRPQTPREPLAVDQRGPQRSVGTWSISCLAAVMVGCEASLTWTVNR